MNHPSREPAWNRQADEGSVLLITVFTALIIGITLGSYLLMVRAQSVAVARSQAWNAALVMAQAGVEEALAALNQNAAGQPLQTPDLSAGGWPHSPRGCPRRAGNWR